MKKFMFRMSLCVMIAFGVVSCKKDPGTEPAPEPVVQWELNEDFSLSQKVVHGGFYTGNRMLLYGPHMFNLMEEDLSVSRFSLSRFPGANLPPSDLFFPQYYEDGFFFTPFANPVRSGTRTYISLPSIDPDYSYVLHPGLNSGKIMAINEQHEFLAAGVNARNKSIQLYRVQVEEVPGFDPAEGVYLQIGETQVIELNQPAGLASGNEVSAMVGYQDYFLVTLPGHTFKIYPNGTWRRVIDAGVAQFFRHKDVIYAPKQFNELYFSYDEGETWSIGSDFPDYFENALYAEVGDSLIVTAMDVLAVMDIEVSGTDITYRLRELENTGMEGNLITTLMSWQGKVYAGTLSGLFTKPIEDFFVSKTE